MHWNTTFPGITVCQVFNGERNWELSEKYYGEDRDKRLDDFIIDITYFSGTCYSCELCQQDLQCPEDFGELLSKVGVDTCTLYMCIKKKVVKKKSFLC